MPPKLSSPFAEIPFLNTPILLVPFLLLLLIYCIVFPNDLRLQSVLAPCQSTSAHQLANGYYTAVDLRVLLGVLTRPDSYERRALLRLAYKLQPPPTRAIIDVRFVLCKITKEEDATLVALEIIAHDDILVLNCTENMNEGKTLEFFSSVPRLFSDNDSHGGYYDYVGKADDDTYYRLAALADALRGRPRRDAYHGFLWPCGEEKEKDPTVEPFMVGWGYIVSWDVAAWISSREEELREDAKGPEDMTFARWLRRGGRGKNVCGEGHRMYEYLDEAWMGGMSCYRHLLVPDTVAVHRLKERVLWARTLRFFNATTGLKPSKMYRVS